MYKLENLDYIVKSIFNDYQKVTLKYTNLLTKINVLNLNNRIVLTLTDIENEKLNLCKTVDEFVTISIDTNKINKSKFLLKEINQLGWSLGYLVDGLETDILKSNRINGVSVI